ncbi:serine/threonine protein kinase [Archangium violaceum]|uniref:serine/threonine protein kinase n=1 Tax=Archangium violaceum TaxID=83451 RepID=UPI001951510E|nr:serine/threonine-protein kinase [Archangium violaceum]QRN96688.1 serine/threonine protein kinase [Archangium violaceum]
MRENESAGGAWGPPGLDCTPGAQVAGFTVEARLASGSFGAVLRASRGGRAFALKLLPLDVRGEREVDSLRKVRHPHVVGLHGYSLWPDDAPRFLVLVLELVEGRPLDVWALEENPSALGLVRQVLLPLASALAAVHASGVVHRDIKEANVLVREADGQPVLVDFGAAGYAGAPRLTAVLPPGTPEYRSPEAWRFVRESDSSEPYPAGPSDDLWALGVATYALLTRRLPFGERLEPGMIRAILQETPAAPHALNSRVPRALSDLCLRMLEKAPEARFPDAGALATALEAELSRADDSWRTPLFPGDSRPVKQAPPVRERPWRTPRRWGAGLALLAALVAAGALSLLAVKGWRPSRASSTTQRVESADPLPSQKAGSRQELAPPQVTGDVGAGAAPPESSIPAPVARATSSEEPEMTKSKPLRGLVAATAVACSACATTPQLPTQADCPPGVRETYERFKMKKGPQPPILLSNDVHSVMPVREGDFSIIPLPGWGDIPSGTAMSGRLVFGKNQVYGRFTEMRLPSGETLPICLELSRYGERGVPMDSKSTRDRVLIATVFDLIPLPNSMYKY